MREEEGKAAQCVFWPDLYPRLRAPHDLTVKLEVADAIRPGSAEGVPLI